MSDTPESRPVRPGDHVFLVDGSSYIFRAYHALPPLTRKSDGLPVGAVSGFANMLWKLLQEGDTTAGGVKPTHIAVVFDAPAQTFRSAIYEDYKATRAEPPDELKPQFGLVRDAVKAFNVPSVEQAGFEADDIIATYTVLAAEAGADVTIVASDKDLMQLIRPGVAMLDTMKDKRIGHEEVLEKFGVPPEKVTDVQALAGDSIDNVPGVPGIGVKTAAQLITEYGDLESLLARAGEIKQQKRRESLIEHAEKARVSKRLVTLDCDVPLAVPLEALGVRQVEGERALAFCKQMEFASLSRRVAQATGAELGDLNKPRNPRAPPPGAPQVDQAAQPQPEADGLAPAALVAARFAEERERPIDLSAYELVTAPERLNAWVAGAFELGRVAIDLVTTDAGGPMRADIVGISLALAPGRAAYVPLAHQGGGDLLGGELAPEQMPFQRAMALLKPLLASPAVLKIGHSLKEDLLVLLRHGIEPQALDDVLLISYALDAGLATQGLEALAQRQLAHAAILLKDLTGSGRAFVPVEKLAPDRVLPWAAERADLALRLWRVLKPRLAAEGMTRVYERLERPLLPVLARMERRGIRVDRQILSRLSGDFGQRLEAFEAEIFDLAGERFNIGSPKQLGDILFGRMGLSGGKKTATGAWGTGADVLEGLAEDGNALAARILDWRQLSKLKSTYTEAIPGYIHPETRRVHTCYALGATSTGRLSSSEPNLQNIPIRTEEGRKIRTAFVAEPGMKLISADYSQIELRILAHVAEIPQLRQAFADGMDIHAITASEMFGVPVDGMPAEVRRRAKAINFGIVYGISAFGLANQLGIDRGEAGDYIKRYFERFPGIRDYMEDTKRFAREHLYVETIFGRRAHYPEINARQVAHRALNERAAINAPIQGSAADIIRRAMIRMDDALDAAGLSAAMLLQVHDELIFEVPEAEVEATIRVVRSVMESAAEPAVRLRVPLKVDARAADNWDEAH